MEFYVTLKSKEDDSKLKELVLFKDDKYIEDLKLGQGVLYYYCVDHFDGDPGWELMDDRINAAKNTMKEILSIVPNARIFFCSDEPEGSDGGPLIMWSDFDDVEVREFPENIYYDYDFKFEFEDECKCYFGSSDWFECLGCDDWFDCIKKLFRT